MADVNHIKALETANWYYDLSRREVKFDMAEAVNDLNTFGLFTPAEIGMVLGIVTGQVKRYIGMSTNMSQSQRIWGVDSLHILWLMALAYEQGEDLPKVLALLAAENGTSVKAMSELCGIPLDIVREAVYDDPNLLGLLRAGADTPSD